MKDDWPMPEPREPNCPPYPDSPAFSFVGPDDDVVSLGRPWDAYCWQYPPRDLIGPGHPRIAPGDA